MTGPYTARADRDEGWWTVTVDEVPGFSRRLAVWIRSQTWCETL